MTKILKIEPDKYDYYEDIAVFRVDKETHKAEYILEDALEWTPTEADIEKLYNSNADTYKLDLPDDLEDMQDLFAPDVKLELA